ncbi:DNA helicase B-like [Gigantopelta aegis]|uniref:DNA helicase B-like n=1 Tax=Gigantopelta aegis TaxID=1735272 RepID=UPI001B88CD7B|nr:DNA helicase B-like [Gigantopelta aegis]
MSQSTNVDVISGYVKVLPSSRDESSDTEDDDNDDDDAWLDFAEMSAMAGGAQFIRCSKPKEQRVTLSTVDDRNRYLFVGRLVLFDPWWLVTSAYVKKSNTFYGRGFPMYDLRRDPVVSRHRLVQQFLTDSTRVEGTNEPLVEELLDYIQQTGDDNHMTFDMLEEKMTEFSQDDEHKLKYIRSLVWKSWKGKMVRFSLMFPNLFKMACRLLPYYLLKLVTSDYDEEKCTELDEVIRNSPWVFGFKQILSREYNLTGMEANISMFETSGIINDVPPVERDALYLYNALKLDARQRGHTYFPLQKLKYSERYFKQYVVRKWKKALEFLEANHVIYIEPEGKCQNIFLYSNWKAERDVADGLRSLLVRGTRDPPKWKVDFSSADFEAIRKDQDQWLATHLVSNSPVTVLSGKGGCGKTTVVTKTLEHICKQSEALLGSVLIERQLSECDAANTPDDDVTHYDVAMQTSIDKQEKDCLSDTMLGSQILLTAPTGKAANLLGHKANLKSCTLHSIIMSYKMHCIERQKRRKEGKDPPVWTHSGKKVLVVDECSLVSVGTFATVLNILLSQCQLSKIVLLGDIRQLPSIEPGNFLTDIFHLFQCLGFGIELRTNHRAESQLIVENATRISNQQSPSFDSMRKFHLLVPEVEDDHYRDVVVRKLLKDSPAVKDHVTSQFVSFRKRDCEAINEICCRHYNQHSLKTPKNKLDFKVGDKVCMTKNGSIVNHLNRLPENIEEEAQELADPNRTISVLTPAKWTHTRNNISVSEKLDSTSCNDSVSQERGVLGRESREPGSASKKPMPSRGYVFGDVSKGSNVETKEKACQTASMGNAEVKLSNGEVFFITDDVTEEDKQGKRHRFLTLSDQDKDREKIVCARFYDLRKECKIKHAWARTIHTYQGSESNTVVYILGNCGFQTWQHVYTAVTRGRKAVYIVGTPCRLDMAVKHKNETRRTSLREKLYNCLSSQEESIKLCQERIQTSLSDYSKRSTQSCEKSPQEKAAVDQPLFDSDDSWMKDIDNSTYGLELNDFETLFPSQTAEAGVDTFENGKTNPCHETCTSFISGDNAEGLPEVDSVSGDGDGVDAKSVKRQALVEGLREVKIQTPVTPVRNILRQLSLDFSLSEDK